MTGTTATTMAESQNNQTTEIEFNGCVRKQVAAGLAENGHEDTADKITAEGVMKGVELTLEEVKVCLDAMEDMSGHGVLHMKAQLTGAKESMESASTDDRQPVWKRNTI